jgi:two-component system, NarL family, response regulator DesR
MTQPYDPLRGRPLSPRELQVLALTADGLAMGEIAARLHVGLSSVRTYRHKTHRKLGARNAAHAIALACRRGDLTLTQEDT